MIAQIQDLELQPESETPIRQVTERQGHLKEASEMTYHPYEQGLLVTLEFQKGWGELHKDKDLLSKLLRDTLIKDMPSKTWERTGLLTKESLR